jgi:hypothetical protein
MQSRKLTIRILHHLPSEKEKNKNKRNLEIHREEKVLQVQSPTYGYLECASTNRSIQGGRCLRIRFERGRNHRVVHLIFDIPL